MNSPSKLNDPEQLLLGVGQLEDKKINLVDSALALALLDSPGLSIERYENHVLKMSEDVSIRHKSLLDGGAEDNAATQIAALKHIIADQNGYEGDSETYEDLQNVNLCRVIDRRKGMPITLSLLYIHIGSMQGWDICALNFPAHVVCRMDKGAERLLFDPFNQCKILQAPDLRDFLKSLVHPDAELQSEFYEVATNREVLIRLQNNIKLRQIEGEDYEGAVKTIERMRMIDPREFRLLLDAGVLYARTNQALAAIAALEKYIEHVPNEGDRQEALYLLQQIREGLN